jgi:universal stress protein F
MFKDILIPVDLSHPDKGNALIDQAKAIAGLYDGKLTLLHVLPEVPAYVKFQVPKVIYDELASTAKADLQDQVKKHGLSTNTEVRIMHGHPARQILNLAADTEADLILISSHQPGLSDYLLGSTASNVVRHARCSVMVKR